MGLLSDSVRELAAGFPVGPMGTQRRFLGWSDTYFGGATLPFRLPGERDVRTSVGDGSGTALITAAINWMARELVPVRPILMQYDAADAQHSGVPMTLRLHPALTLEQRPNAYYDGGTMRQACALSYIVDGNVYRWKIRSRMSRVVEKWYLPHWAVEPIGEGSFIDFYRFQSYGFSEDIAPEDIEHLRFGLDPQNPRKGLSPIRGVLREVYTDEQAARFSAALLANMAFPGAVVIPGQGVELDEDGAKSIKDRFDQKFGADNRGKTIVLSANADVKFLQWTPKDLNLGDLRDVPEERVSAAIGIPAAVLGFGTGLQQVKVGATMRELRAMGWEGALIPFLEQLAQNETSELLPEFIGGRDLERTEFAFDLSRIAALSEMHLRNAEIEATLVRARIKKVDESRMALGLPAVGGDDGGFQASPGVGGAGFKDAPPPSEGVRRMVTGGEGDETTIEDDEEAALLAAAGARVGDDLTPREREVAILAGNGRTNKEIAAALAVSERSVERYLASAKTKLNVVSRAELGAFARSGASPTRSDPTRELAAALVKQGEAVARGVVESAKVNAEGMQAVAAAVAAPRVTEQTVTRKDGKIDKVRAETHAVREKH